MTRKLSCPGKFQSLKIAVVTGLFPVTSETFVVDHIAGLIEKGHTVDVFAFGPPREAPHIHWEISRYGLMDRLTIFPYYRLPKGEKERWKYFIRFLKNAGWRHPVWLSRCSAFLKRGPSIYFYVTAMAEPLMRRRYDVIHCHFGTNAQPLTFVKKIFKRCGFFVTFHGYDVRRGLEGQADYHELFRCVDRVISICGFNREKLVALGCPEDKLAYLPNGVDVDFFRRQPDAARSKRFVIITVARLHKVKNIPFALDIIKEIVKKRTDVEYRIIGEGESRSEVEGRIELLNLNCHVRLIGGVKHHQVRDHLAQADIVLLTSLNEALPVTLLEAQAMEIPVVATRVGGVCEAVCDQVSGILIDPGDAKRAAKQILELMDDPARCESMGRAGREFVKSRFNRVKVLQDMEGLYYGKP